MISRQTKYSGNPGLDCPCLQRALLDPAPALVDELIEVLALVVAVDRQEDG